MDFRLARLNQKRTFKDQVGVNVVSFRDYTERVRPWGDENFDSVINIADEYDFENILKRRNFLVGIVKSFREPISYGVKYNKDILKWIEESEQRSLDYALISGIIDQMGKAIDSTEIPEDVIRVMWYGDIADNSENIEESIKERWSWSEINSILKDDKIKFSDVEFSTDEITHSDEFKDLHLGFIDINAKARTVKIVFSEDRSIVEEWHGYIPVEMGGKPSVLSNIRSDEKYKANTAPVSLKKIRREKMRELDRIREKYPMAANNNYFEYLKDIGSFLGVAE